MRRLAALQERASRSRPAAASARLLLVRYVLSLSRIFDRAVRQFLGLVPRTPMVRRFHDERSNVRDQNAKSSGPASPTLRAGAPSVPRQAQLRSRNLYGLKVRTGAVPVPRPAAPRP